MTPEIFNWEFFNSKDNKFPAPIEWEKIYKASSFGIFDKTLSKSSYYILTVALSLSPEEYPDPLWS